MSMRTRIMAIVGGAAAVLACACDQKRRDIAQTPAERQWRDPEASARAAAAEPIDPVILPKTHFAAALLLEQEGDLEKAIIQYRKAVATNHNYVEAYNRLGVLLGRQGRHAEAEQALQQAIALKPRVASMHNNLGYEYALQGRWGEAENELNQATRLKPGFARAYVNLGLVLSKQGRFDEALDAFNAVLPEADALYNLGLVLASADRYGEAADAFSRVLALNPKFAAARKQLDHITPMIQAGLTVEPESTPGVQHASQGVGQAFQPVSDVDEAVMARADGPAAAAQEPGGGVATDTLGDTTAIATKVEAESVAILIEAVTGISVDEFDAAMSMGESNAAMSEDDMEPSIGSANVAEMAASGQSFDLMQWISPLISALKSPSKTLNEPRASARAEAPEQGLGIRSRSPLSPPPEIEPIDPGPAATAAELTAAESAELSSDADQWDETVMADGPWVTYEPCDLDDGSDWLISPGTAPISAMPWLPQPMAAAKPLASPLAAWALSQRVMAHEDDQTPEPDAPPAQDAAALIGTFPPSVGMCPHLYATWPELQADEFVDWTIPCPVHQGDR